MGRHGIETSSRCNSKPKSHASNVAPARLTGRETATHPPAHSASVAEYRHSNGCSPSHLICGTVLGIQSTPIMHHRAGREQQDSSAEAKGPSRVPTIPLPSSESFGAYHSGPITRGITLVPQLSIQTAREVSGVGRAVRCEGAREVCAEVIVDNANGI